MRSKKGYLALGSIALAVAIAAWMLPGQRPPPSTGEQDQAAAAAVPLPVPRDKAAALSATKIDPTVVVPAAGHAFSIVRQQRLPDTDPLDHVRSLLGRSQAGDAAATYEIYLVVSQCNATLEVPDPGLLQVYRKAGAEKSYLESLETNFDRCQSLTAEQALSAQPWLARAAGQGSVEAKIMFAIDSKSIIGDRSGYLAHAEQLVQYRQDAMRHLHEAASLGSVDALMHLATSYDAGVLTAPSQMQSLAYYKAVNAVQPNANLQTLIDRKTQGMSAQDVQRASGEAERILAACCR